MYILELNSHNTDGTPNYADNNNFYPYKIVDDNCNSYKEICKRHNAKHVFKCYLFPAEIDVKRMLNGFNYKYYFDYNDINEVLTYILSLNPIKVIK